MARAFFKAGFIESWGRGFKKIREELDRVNMPMPNVEENCGGVMAVMKRFTMEEIIARREETGDKTSDITGDITGDIVSANVSANVGSFVGGSANNTTGFGDTSKIQGHTTRG